MTLQDLQHWAEILGALSLIVAALVAVGGISAWRREHVGKRKAELAEETLALFYQAADAVRHMRNPFAWSSEWEERESSEIETSAQKHARDQTYVVFHRHKQYSELFGKLRATRYRFMALFGTTAAQPFDELNRIMHEIFVAARVLASLWEEQGTPMTEERTEKHLRDLEKYEAVFWELGESNDPLRPRLKALLADIEATCRSAIVESSAGSKLSQFLESGRKAIEDARRW